MRTLFESELLKLEASADGRVAWIARTSRPIVGNEGNVIERLLLAVETLPAAHMGLIVDLRQALGRNDEAFERSVLPAFRAIPTRFARVAFLVATQVGKLQVQRTESRLGTGAQVFTDEAEAVRFATGDG